MAEYVSKVRARLGAELRRLRLRADRPQDGLGTEQLPLHQTTVSRMENGQRVPRPEQAEAWLVYATAAERDIIEALLDAAYRETRTYDEMFDGQQHLQDDVADRDAAARVVRSYAPTVIPGMLQTAEYARRVFELGAADVPQAVAARMARQQMLYEPGRRFEFLISEHILSCAVAPSARTGQMHHLASVATVESVELGIVPADRVPALAWHGFSWRYPTDGSADYVTAELVDGLHTVHDEMSVAKYRQVWAALHDAAVFDEDAAKLMAG